SLSSHDPCPPVRPSSLLPNCRRRNIRLCVEFRPPFESRMSRSSPRNRRHDAPQPPLRAVRGFAWCGALALLCLFAASGLRGDADSEDQVGEPLTAVRVEGNQTIPNSDIAKHIKTRPGRAASPKQIKDDVEALVRTRWFAIVEPSLRQTE